MSESKACTKCGEVKASGEFRPSRNACRDCERNEARARQPRYYAANRESCIAAMRRYQEENREKIAADHRVYYAQRRDHFAALGAARYAEKRDILLAKSAEYYARTVEQSKARARRWAKANPELVRGYSAQRKARRRNAPIVERVYRAKVWERDGGRCHICGKKADPNNWHLEHIVPLAAGGEHSYRNVAVSHPACNLRKGVRGPGQLRLVA